jgi:hypothetical protein
MKLQREAEIDFVNARRTWMTNKRLLLLLGVIALSLTACGPLSVSGNPRGFVAGQGFIAAFRSGSPAAAVSVPVSTTRSIVNMAYWQQPGVSANSVDLCPGRNSCEKLFFAAESEPVLQVMDAPTPEAPGTPVIRKIDLGKTITDLATSRTEDGGYIFASHQYSGGISVISPGSETVHQFWSSPDVPQPGALSVHQRWGFVLSGSTLARFQIDQTSAETMDLGGNPTYLSDGFGGVVGVTDFSANLVHLVTTVGVWGDSTVSVPSPARIILSNYQNLAFVASVPDTANGVTPPGSVYVVDTFTGTVVKSIPVGYCISSLKIFLQTDGAEFNIDPTISDESLIVTNQCDSTFTRIDLATLKVVGTYPSLGQARVAEVQP